MLIVSFIVTAIMAIVILYFAILYLIYCLSDKGNKPFPKQKKNE